MDKAAYHTRWDKLEDAQREQNDLPESGVQNRAALHKMLTLTFRDFVIACYCDYWRDDYKGAAFTLNTNRDVLVARTITHHHWTPGIASNLSTHDLALSLINDLAHFPLPAMAIHVAYMNLQDLPKEEYQALIGPHEEVAAN